MLRSFRFIFMILFSITLVSLSNSIWAEKYTPVEDGKFSVKCSCVLGTSLCHLKTFDEAAGKPRQEWIMDQYGKAGKEIDLNASCWRKRDAEKMGDGLCCTVEDDENGTIEKLFSGVKQN